MQSLNALIGSDATIIVDFPGEGDDDDSGSRRRAPSLPPRRERQRPIKWAASLNDGRRAILFLDDDGYYLIVGTSRILYAEYIGEMKITTALCALGIERYPDLIRQLPESISNCLQKAAS
ncbi:hypothetical protein EBT31_03045 [bacterium]|nr:hypothetical protein [bacterium]NBX49495.1 hypothetical protein [bacterium]